MKSNFSGFVVALLAGAVVGVLLAPRSGKDTRKKVSGDTDKFLKDLQDTISTGFEGIRKQYEDTRDNVKSQYNDAVETISSKAHNGIESAERKSKY